MSRTFAFNEAETDRLRELFASDLTPREIADHLTMEFGGVLAHQHVSEMVTLLGLTREPAAPPVEEMAAPPASRKPGKAAPQVETPPAPPAAPETPPADPAPETPPAPPADGAAQ